MHRTALSPQTCDYRAPGRNPGGQAPRGLQATDTCPGRSRLGKPRQSSSNAQCEQFNGGNPEHQHRERYRIVFEPNTHDTPHMPVVRTQ
jgi:hypothetical protein